MGTNPPKGHSRPDTHTHFSAHVCCGKTAGWINMPLGKVGLGWDDMLDGDPDSPHGKGHSSHHFSAHVCWGQKVAHLSYCWALVYFAAAAAATTTACTWNFVYTICDFLLLSFTFGCISSVSKYLLVSLRQELDAASLRGLPFPKPHTAERPGAGSLTPFSVSSLACNEFVTGILVNKETMSFETWNVGQCPTWWSPCQTYLCSTPQSLADAH